MNQSIQASTNGVAFRRPTFDLGRVLKKAFMNFVGFWESVGRAKAAHELARLGYMEEAKQLILKERG